jgi:hypothetical protein
MMLMIKIVNDSYSFRQLIHQSAYKLKAILIIVEKIITQYLHVLFLYVIILI